MPSALSATESTADEIPINFSELPLILGRSDQADIRIVDRWVSRRHCELLQAGEVLMVRDLGSRHGILVNAEPVEKSLLRIGDHVSLGLTTFVVRSASNGTASPSRGELLLVRHGMPKASDTRTPNRPR